MCLARAALLLERRKCACGRRAWRAAWWFSLGSTCPCCCAPLSEWRQVTCEFCDWAVKGHPECSGVRTWKYWFVVSGPRPQLFSPLCGKPQHPLAPPLSETQSSTDFSSYPVNNSAESTLLFHCPAVNKENKLHPWEARRWVTLIPFLQNSSADKSDLFEGFGVFVVEDILAITVKGSVVSGEVVTREVGALVSQAAWTAATDYHRLIGWNSRNVFAQSSGDSSPRSGYQQGWFLVRYLFLGCRWPPSHSVLTWAFLSAQDSWYLFLF